MYALTVKQPWAQAIAQFGKNVENRSKRPPGHLIGQRIAIHVGKTWSTSDFTDYMSPDLVEWLKAGVGGPGSKPGQVAPPPHAGRIIATARLVGYRYNNVFCLNRPDGTVADVADYDLVVKSTSSPWYTGPVAWVLADVVMLLEPVGQECPQCTGHGSLGHLNLPASYPVLCDMCNGVGTEPIRGKLGCWPVPHAIAAQVHEQEQMARGRR